MTQRLQIYKCEICGNIVEMQHEGAGELVCCGEPMKLYQENTVDAAVEKHAPVIEPTECCVKVKVGSVAHPMTPEHHIEWVQLIKGDMTRRTYLQPGDAPEAEFCCESDGAVAREYCNLHGLWKS